MGYANDGLRFLLELSALAALAYWGVSEFGGLPQWLLGLGLVFAGLAVLHLGLTFAFGQRPAQPVV